MGKQGNETIRREIIAIVLLLIITLSLVGAYTFLRATDSFQQKTVHSSQKPSITITILPSEEENEVANGNQ